MRALGLGKMTAEVIVSRAWRRSRPTRLKGAQIILVWADGRRVCKVADRGGLD